MSTSTRLNGVYGQSGQNRFDYLKGAPEIILEMCTLSTTEKKEILAKVDEWAGNGLRLLGLAYRPHKTLEDPSGYTWAGLLAMEDPIREGVAEAAGVARKAGIKIKMITGDYRRTAERIACNIGLMEDGDAVMEGAELAEPDGQRDFGNACAAPASLPASGHRTSCASSKPYRQTVRSRP